MVSIVRRVSTFLLIAVLIASALAYPSAGRVLAQGSPMASRPEPAPAPNFAATPSVSLTGLGDVMIGENFTFNVSFANTGSSAGYGPFIDLVLPTNGADGDYNRAVQDGVDFVQATLLGYTFSATQNTLSKQKFPDPTGSPAYPSGYITCVDHPWARQSDGEFAQVCGPAGDTLVSLRLPFGAFVPGQPGAELAVEATLSNLADVDAPLNIRARGGFLYGNDPLDNWCCGDGPIFNTPSTNSGSWPPGPIVPKIITLQKSYSGPDNVQDETTSGPNFTRQYTLAVNVANGQTITNLDVVDPLPDNEQFTSLDVGGTTPGYAITSIPVTTLPGGTLSLRYGSVTGSASATDLTMVFNFYIPRLDAGGAAVINPVSGDDVLSENPGWGSGDWTPPDARDAAEVVASETICVPGGICTPLHTLAGKSMAIQKSAANITDSNPSPGDVFEYRLAFQVSDYFAFGAVSVTDLLSDGQHVLSSFAPTLQINGNGYTLSAAALGAANYDVSCNYSGGPGAECTANNPAADDGTTQLVFRVSPEIIARGQNGRMVGGCVNPLGGLLPVCSPASPGDGPTTGVITFRVVMQDAFTNNYPSGDPSVDQGDELTNNVQTSATVLDNNTFGGGQLETDDAIVHVTVPRDDFSKEIYAINGDTNPTNWQRANGNVEIKPGDTVTYRMVYNLNTSDVEDLAFEDYLPLPVFFVDDPDADDNIAPKHDNGPVFIFDDVTSAAAPAVGHAQFGPTDTFRSYSGIVPTLSRNPAQNVLRFNYGDYDNPANQSTIVDLLFTLTVSSEPFADQAFITNQAHQVEGSTNTGAFTQDALQWIVLTQPALSTTKGVIWTSSSSAVLDPQPAGPVGFSGPGAAPRWSGTINSSMLAANPINSDITGVRPGDIVSFAIAVENKGSSLLGAFDIVIRDTMPSIYAVPAGGPNLQIYYGNGTGPIATEVDAVVTQADCVGGWPGNPCGPDMLANTPDDIFGWGIKLVDPVGAGVCQAYNPNLGNNVILVTYDLQVQDSIQPGTYTNSARLSNYGSYEGGVNHAQDNRRVQDTAETSWIRAKTLANTGFAPQRVTNLPVQPANARYTAMPNLWLEIPTLDVKLPIIGIPNTSNGWDLTWLSNQAGYLQGTTPPTAVGNTALTAHVSLADGSPGPFINLGKLRWGQTIILHADGYRYTYQVRQNRLVLPTNLSVFKEDGYAWLTLLTCKGYDETKQTYRYRIAVRAILLSVEPE